MKLVRSTCCGCSVKTGALVISYITFIQAVVPILNILSNTVPDMSSDKKLSNEYKRDLMLLSVATVIVVAHALYGIYKKKVKYMIPFMLYKLVLIFIFTMILGFAPAMVDEIKKHFESIRDDNVLPCIIVTSLFFLAVEAYFLLILFSHYQNVRHETMEAEHSRQSNFSAVIPDPISPSIPSYASEASKKMAPPPYAV